MAAGPKAPRPTKAKGTAVAATSSEEPAEVSVVTAIHIPRDLLRLLREVAVARADVAGGRPSVSAVLVDLVRQNREKLAREAGR